MSPSPWPTTPDTAITKGSSTSVGDPYAVFVKSDGTIAKIVRGDELTPASFTADERALLSDQT